MAPRLRLGRIAGVFGGAVVMFLYLRLFVAEAIIIGSDSMEPTLAAGTMAFVDKLTLQYRPPLRGEIILFNSPVGPHEEMGKRVIAVGGDIVEMRRRLVYVNGVRLSEPYVSHLRPREPLIGENLPSFKVPEGRLFVLGDNRDWSEDSSYWMASGLDPFVPEASVVGLIRPLPGAPTVISSRRRAM